MLTITFRKYREPVARCKSLKYSLLIRLAILGEGLSYFYLEV